MAQNYDIFCQFRSRLAISQAIAIKWKEKYDAVVVDCNHSLRLCGEVTEWKWVSLKKIFLERLPLLPGSHSGSNFSSKGDYFTLVPPSLFPVQVKTVCLIQERHRIRHCLTQWHTAEAIISFCLQSIQDHGQRFQFFKCNMMQLTR